MKGEMYCLGMRGNYTVGEMTTVTSEKWNLAEGKPELKERGNKHNERK